jgi:hypothetical protein
VQQAADRSVPDKQAAGMSVPEELAEAAHNAGLAESGLWCLGVHEQQLGWVHTGLYTELSAVLSHYSISGRAS